METSVARTEQRGGGLTLDGSDRGSKKWILEIDLFLYLLIFCFFFFFNGRDNRKETAMFICFLLLKSSLPTIATQRQFLSYARVP